VEVTSGTGLRKRRYISVSEAALLMQMNRETVWRWCRSGAIIALRAGPRKRWLIPVAVIREQFAVSDDDLESE
jgi:excisionase family DNA binding protein